jgi:hypothetical protein
MESERRHPLWAIHCAGSSAGGLLRPHASTRRPSVERGKRSIERTAEIGEAVEGRGFNPPGVHMARDQSVSTGSKRLSSCAFIKRWCPPMRPVDDGSLPRIGRRCDPGDQADDDGPELVGP